MTFLPLCPKCDMPLADGNAVETTRIYATGAKVIYLIACAHCHHVLGVAPKPVD